MALYLGNNKVKIILDDIIYNLNLYSEKPITSGIMMLSSEGYILTDSSGLYLTLKESE